MLEDIRNIKSGKKEIREFGLTIGTILVILGLVALWRGKEIVPYFLTAGILLGVFGLIFPRALKPLQKIWMTFSLVVGFFMSRVIISILFFAVLTPIGLIMRLLGKDILDQKQDKSRESYWQDRPGMSKNKKNYENQY